MPELSETSKTVISIEARMTSTRLPGKVLMEIDGKPLLEIMVERVMKAECYDEIVIATTTNDDDDPVVQLAERLGVGYFRGSEDDVLGRVLRAHREHDSDICVELTGDCPLMDSEIVDFVYDSFLEKCSDGHHYVSNINPTRFVPPGFDVEIFPRKSLEEMEKEATTSEEREHVSPGFWKNKNWNPTSVDPGLPEDATDYYVTVDYREDYELVKNIYQDLYPANPEFGASEIINWIREHPDLQKSCQELRKSNSR